jgi:adenylosuccinate synthase
VVFLAATIVVGSQFGDEGKGKLVDLLAEKADLVVRFNGGNNAGHTVVVKGQKYKLHLMPSGAIQGKKCLIGAGIALDPRVLIKEIEQVKGKFRFELVIDPRAQVILPWHNALDGANETAKGEKKIGTTGRGIGPCYADRASRTGIRFSDLVDGKRLKARVEEAFPLKQKILEKVFGGKMPQSMEAVLEEYNGLGKELAPFLGDVSKQVSEALEKGKNVLLEGAQGTFLDNDFGTYPFVTSSHPTAGAVFTGIGIGVRPIERVVGIVKAYTTRVGEGPFATELEGELGEKIREAGQEFGTTTGRPRRVGWLDLVLVRTAARLNGFTEIALTKLDVLSGLENVMVCTEYELNGEKIREMPADSDQWKECRPVYKAMPGFQVDSKAKSFEGLQEEAKKYVEFIEEQVSVPVKTVSIGPGREETLKR